MPQESTLPAPHSTPVLLIIPINCIIIIYINYIITISINYIIILFIPLLQPTQFRVCTP